MPQKVMIVAGESSADLHGSRLAQAMKSLAPDVELIGAGGQKMREAGVRILYDITRYAAVGPVETMRHFTHYLEMYRRLTSALYRERPDVVVLIDFPDFNLRFGERVRDNGIPIVYFISPQVWAWRTGRIRTIARLVRKMLVIFEFEKDLYQKAGVDVSFVGHPLMDILKEENIPTGLRDELKLKKGELLIGLLPGSRDKEVRQLFPLMLAAAERIRKDIPDTRFVVACAPEISLALLDSWKTKTSVPFDVVWNRTYEAMRCSDFLIVASGTATVEAAIIGTPMVVTYRVNPLSLLILLPTLKIRDFAMVNIVAGRRIVPEFYQGKARPDWIAAEATRLIKSGGLSQMRKDLTEVRRKLGTPGASMRAAQEILGVLSESRRKP